VFGWILTRLSVRAKQLLTHALISGNAQQLGQEMNQVYRENFEMRGTFDSLGKENEHLKHRISLTEQKLSNIEQMIQDLKT
jgi:flagellar capping protein FliD